MPPEDSSYAVDWVRIADKDQERVLAFHFVERYPIRPGIVLTSDEVESMRDAVGGLIEALRKGLD